MEKLPALNNNPIEENAYNPEDDFNVKVDEDNNQYIDNKPPLNPNIIFKEKPKSKPKRKKNVELKDNLQKEEYIITEKSVEPTEKSVEPNIPKKNNLRHGKVQCERCGAYLKPENIPKHQLRATCINSPHNPNRPKKELPLQSPATPQGNVPTMTLNDTDNFNQFLKHYKKLKDMKYKEDENKTLVEEIISKKNERKRKENLKKTFIREEPIKIIKEEPIVEQNIIEPKIHNPYAYCFGSGS